MKKSLFILIICFIVAICGCSNKSSGSNINEDFQTDSPKDMLVDLTKLSSTMVYSEVYNIMSNPNDYIGRNIKMSGKIVSTVDQADGNKYYACLIEDAAGCCSQGIEFSLADEDYPKENTEVTVLGIFSKYNIGKNTYYTLKDSKLVK